MKFTICIKDPSYVEVTHSLYFNNLDADIKKICWCESMFLFQLRMRPLQRMKVRSEYICRENLQLIRLAQLACKALKPWMSYSSFSEHHHWSPEKSTLADTSFRVACCLGYLGYPFGKGTEKPTATESTSIGAGLENLPVKVQLQYGSFLAILHLLPSEKI